MASQLFAPMTLNMFVVSGLFTLVKTSISLSILATPPASIPRYSLVLFDSLEPILLYVFYYCIVSGSNKSQFVFFCLSFRPFSIPNTKYVCFSNNFIITV